MKNLAQILIATLMFIVLGPLQAQAFTGGFVDGTVTLTKANSPYTFTQPVQVSQNSTLRVEPGVTIRIRHEGVAFKAAGTIEMLGSATEKIRIEGAVTLFETAGSFASKANFRLSFVEAVALGSIFTDLNQGQNLAITDSLFIGDVNQKKAMYNWLSFCTQCSFERNVFRNLPGFRFFTHSAGGEVVQVRNNLFIGNSSSELLNGGWIVTEGRIELSGNSFIKFSKPVIQRDGSQVNLVLDGNYFDGLTLADVAKIAVRDLSAFPIVFNAPLAAPSPLTPVEPTVKFPVRQDFLWKFKRSTLEITTTRLASPSDAIRVNVNGRDASTVVFANSNRVTLKFPGMSLNGRGAKQIFISSNLFRNQFDLDQTYASCQEMWVNFDGGVARAASSRNKGTAVKRQPTVFPNGYSANATLDTDRDGIACER